MFYRPNKHDLKAQLEERLRTALDFATLGAYEPEAPPQQVLRHETPKRVFLFAKVSPPCPHSAAPLAACDAAGADTAEPHRVATAARALVGTRRRSRRSRRGGAVKLAPQPCTWSAERTQG